MVRPRWWWVFLVLPVAGMGILAAWVRRLLRREEAPAPPPEERGPRVVVLGGGFGGLRFATHFSRYLHRVRANLTLIDANNYHLFFPLLYQVATGGVTPDNIAYPLRRAASQQRFHFLKARISAVDLADRCIRTDQGDVPYDYLVISLGSTTNYFGVEGAEQHTCTLKNLRGASTIRGHLLDALEEAAAEDDPARRREYLTFAVVGAGATGVELASSIHDLIHHTLIADYPMLSYDDVRIILVEGKDRVLSMLDPRMGAFATSRLQEMKVELRLGTVVKRVAANGFETASGEFVGTRSVIWTAGVKPHALAATLPVERSQDGRILVDEYLRVPGQTHIYALGDIAYFINPHTGRPAPANASIAVRQAVTAAENVRQAILGLPPLPHRKSAPGELIALGRTSAVAQIGPWVFGGFPAWFVWRSFYLLQLLGLRNRLGVFLDWAFAFFYQRHVAGIRT